MAMTYGGIMYFPMSISFFEDAPIELVEAKCGLAGTAAVMKLLCKLHKEQGYYLLWGEDQCTLFAHKAGLEEELMKEIIGILTEKGFFDKACYEKDHILTSLQIQKIWLEATKRRKRELSSLPFLMEELKEPDPKKKVETAECVQKNVTNVQNADNFVENADFSAQSKVKKNKAEQSKAGSEEGSPSGGLILSPPGYVYNKQTHNYDGLLFNLEQMGITDPDEVNAILRLSDYGRLKGYVWKVIHSTHWSQIFAKGKFLVAALAKERRQQATRRL